MGHVVRALNNNNYDQKSITLIKNGIAALMDSEVY